MKPFKDYFKKDREKEKQEVVSSVVNKILFSQHDFTHAEQSELLNRATIRIFEQKKETRSKLIQEAREVQQSLIDFNLDTITN